MGVIDELPARVRVARHRLTVDNSRRPQGEGYLDTTETARPGILPLAALPGASVDLAGLL